jgi:vitamin B12 transporter
MEGSVRLLRSTMLLAVSASLATAQPPADTTRLAPVVVTASRTTTSRNVAAEATTVLGGDALRARGITTLAAALREVPATTIVQTSGPGSQTSLFLRGGEADYVQVMIDGVTINEPGGTINLANLSLDNVERIEIVRGPTSVLYGANAMTGVIQIFTRGASERSDGELRVRGGQRGLLDAEGSLGLQRGASGYWVGVGHHASKGIYDLNNDTRNSTVSGRFRFAPVSAATVTVTARYADARYDYPTEYYGDDDGAPIDSNSYNTERRLSAGASAVYALRPTIDLRLAVGMSQFQNITSDPIDNRTGEIGDDGSPLPFETRSLRRNADAQADLRFIPGATLTIGGEYDWQQLESEGQDPATDSLLDRWSVGTYAQLVGNGGSRFSYTLGGRVEKNELFGSLGSLRVGVGLLVAPSITVRASVGTAFKEPQFFEITGAGFALPNPTLRPERSSSWEVGVQQRFLDGALALGATYFDQGFRQMIMFSPIPVTSGYSAQYINAQAAESRGWELEARAEVPGGMTARASYTALAADFRATPAAPAAPLPRRASRTGSLVITAPITSRFTFTSDASYIGPRPDTRFFPIDPFLQQVELPAYSLLGIGGVYVLPRRGSGGVELMARVDNVLDERYQAVAGFATPRRTASVGVRITVGR